MVMGKNWNPRIQKSQKVLVFDVANASLDASNPQPHPTPSSLYKNIAAINIFTQKICLLLLYLQSRSVKSYVNWHHDYDKQLDICSTSWLDDYISLRFLVGIRKTLVG